MKLRMYQVDAFTDELFHGNPAAVCPLRQWLTEGQMQSIAAENNLSETAFFVPKVDKYEIRWFTPAVEVDLCGHATLASGYVLFHLEEYAGQVVEFDSRSGVLAVRRNGDLLTLDFPADPPARVEAPDELLRGLGVRPAEAWRGKSDYMLVFGSQKEIEEMSPDFGLLARVAARGIIVTAEGDDVDFVSRFFGPQSGVNEDPVTGSAHTTLTPYWSARLGKQELRAVQLSRRRGWLQCRMAGNRVEISGQARAYLEGWIEVP
ncbi:MAG: PhzF family phenazine biosynthesis protein [Acidobacteria bacterium]|nr:PhzF family phenazine biosynthesis protein [Acidobacteriota bacterium]